MQLGTTAGIDYRLLGATEAGLNGHTLDIGGQKQRALLAILLLSANKPVSRDVLVDRRWGEHPVGLDYSISSRQPARLYIIAG